MEEQHTQQVDRKDLKLQAYSEKITEQESLIADLRVDVFILSQRLNEVQSQLDLQGGPDSEVEETPAPTED